MHLKKIAGGTFSCGVKSAYGIHYHSRSGSQTLQTHWKMGWIILLLIITFVVIAVGYSGSSRWWYSQCTLITAGAAKASVSLGSSRENSALSSCPSQPEVCSAPRWLLHLAWEKQLIVYVCSGEGRAGRSSAWAGKFWTILRMCVGHNFRRLVTVHLLSIKMSWQELTARLRLRILVWLFWRSEPDASEENPRNPVVAR